MNQESIQIASSSFVVVSKQRNKLSSLFPFMSLITWTAVPISYSKCLFPLSLVPFFVPLKSLTLLLPSFFFLPPHSQIPTSWNSIRRAGLGRSWCYLQFPNQRCTFPWSSVAYHSSLPLHYSRGSWRRTSTWSSGCSLLPFAGGSWFLRGTKAATTYDKRLAGAMTYIWVFRVGQPL